MRFDVVTIFPKIFPGPLGEGVIGKALQRGIFELQVHDLRSWAEPPHHKVDDEPFGGGAGMVFTPGPMFDAVHAIREQLAGGAGRVLMLSPQGRRLDHGVASELAQAEQMTLLCGRYEGVDERVRQELVDEEISVGDYVLSGGELAAMVLIEAVVRLRPEALGDPESARQDSFVDGLLDHPQYTRPAIFRGLAVPEVLRSGDHQRIREWRRREGLRNTALKRPDLLQLLSLDSMERRFVDEIRSTAESDRAERGSALK